ncbi:PREDICTED: uncharacterized protein LOC106117522 [Papilio xuthus]|uniref:Uncharacterized protein LOC106117522 n=1 Tax=Papilio xuthus TaxID=66420 RepID=A0AAJ6Z8N7_PAPXU|nr:PREDICTED: uncharacterized protein LOC106117522 [Papilio xuthus]
MSSSDDLNTGRGRRWRHRKQDDSDDEEGSCDSIKNTESKKSVTTSVYSGDFTDCSERNVNSSRDSYDTDWEESDDNVSITSCQLHRVHSRVNIPRQSVTSLVDSEMNLIGRVEEQQNFANASSTSMK